MLHYNSIRFITQFSQEIYTSIPHTNPYTSFHEHMNFETGGQNV